MATELDSLLQRLTERAESEWPHFRLERLAFRQRLMRDFEAWDDDIAVLLQLHVADLYLALACELGTSAAITSFATIHLAGLDMHLKRFRRSSLRVDDLRREMEDTLLFGKGDRPGRIGQYRGRGPLKNFVAATARNITLTMLRSERRRARNVDVLTETSMLSRIPAPIASARNESAVRDAVRSALLELDRRQRTVVRLHVVQGVTLTQIGRMLKVNQSTVSRTLDAALRFLQRKLRRELRDGCGMTESEMLSVIRDVRCTIELNWSHISCEQLADLH
jgi:RNA polymerase sigma-70 factor (ECF subfamily)